MAQASSTVNPQSNLCTTCGSRLKPGATRCTVCGTPVGKNPGGRLGRTAAAQVSLPLPTALIILAVFVLITAGLTFGATRLLPGAAPENATGTPTSTPTETATPRPTATETPVPTFTPLPTLEYIVSAGDTFLGIAVRYDVSVQSILQHNPGLNSSSILSVGQKLYLPQPTPTASPQPTATLPPDEATRAACETITYTVEANDTLGAVATNYNVKPLAIMDYNGMTSETVFLGQILIIPLCERNPTPGPSPTPTPPPPYPAPNLLLPQDGAAFTLAQDSVTLQWASVGQLRENEFYRVFVEDITEGSGTRKIVDYVKDTKYVVTSDFRPSGALPHIMRWRVQVFRQVGVNADGDPLYESGGDASHPRDFTWAGAGGEATPTP